MDEVLGPMKKGEVRVEGVGMSTVRVAATRYREERRLLVQAIREAHAAGKSLRVIAEAAGLSHGAIAKILAKS